MQRLTRSAAARAVLCVAIGSAGCATETSDGGNSGAAEESAAVVAADVPAPATELSDSFGSIFALAEAILQGIETGDVPALLQYRVDESEWYHIVWPRLPASQPGRNLPWDYAWRDLDQKSRNAIAQTIADWRGRRFRLLRVDFAGETTGYETYRVHRDARCVVQREDGEIITLDLFGSVIEHKGRFKAFSYVVD